MGAFTIAVIILIALVLVALVLSTAGRPSRGPQARGRVESEIQALSAALESYKMDHGDYPIGSNASVNTPAATPGPNTFLVTSLMPSTGKVYFEFNKSMLDTNGGTTNVVDPYRERYAYIYFPSNKPAGAMSGTNFFDLWSRRGSANSNKWVTNW